MANGRRSASILRGGTAQRPCPGCGRTTAVDDLLAVLLIGGYLLLAVRVVRAGIWIDHR